MPPPRPSRRERRGAGAPPRALRGPPRSVVGVAAPYPLLPPTSILAFTAAAGVARPVGGAVTAAATPTTSAAVVRRGGGGGRCRPWCGGLAAARRPAGAAALPCLRGTTGTAWAGGAVTPAAPRRRLLRVSPAGGDAVPSRGLPPPPPGLSWVVVVCAATGGEGGGPPAAPTPSGRGPDGDAAAGAAAPTPTANADSAAVTTDAAAVDGAPRPWWAPIAPLWAAFKRAGFVVGLATGLAVSGVVLFAPEGGGADGAGVAAVREKTTLFEYILTDLQRGYVEEVDMDALFEAGVEGMLGTLDPYTSFESVAEARELSLKTAGKYGGVGLGISLDRRDPSRVVVISAFEGYAYDAGVRPGDVLETVNGQPVANLGVSATSDLLRGDPGTPVSITVARSGEPAALSFSLTRRRVVIKDVPVAALLGAPAEGVAYIRLASFARDAAEECRFALRGLDAAVREAGGSGVTSLVLDLRGNPGGLLTSAVEVAEVVLPKGSVVVSTKGRGLGQEPRYVSSAEPAIGPAVRLAVLVNGGTASASEIVAGAVQDLDRGVVVGSRTFGKGLVQNVQTLPYDTALKYTVGKYYTPSGRCIQATNYSTASVTPALPPPPPPPMPVTPAPLSVPSAPAPLLPPGDDAEPGSPITDASPATGAPEVAPAASPEPPSPGSGPASRPPAPPSRPVGPPGAAYKSRAVTESERRDFRTASGRLVRDGGGIEADVTVPTPPPSDLEAALRMEAAFFYYAADYAAGLPAGLREVLPDDFAVTDALYADFVAWVSDNAVVSDGGPALPAVGASDASVRGPSATKSSSSPSAGGAARRPPPSIKLESRFVEAYAQLEEALRSAGYDNAIASVEALKAATAAELRADFTRHEKALRAALDDAIRQRLQPDSDRMVAALETDEALRVALEVVRDGERYAGVLRSPTVTFAGAAVGAGGVDAEVGAVAQIARRPDAADQ